MVLPAPLMPTIRITRGRPGAGRVGRLILCRMAASWFAARATQCGRVGEFLATHASGQIGDDAAGRVHTDIGGQQQCLDVFEQVVVDLAAAAEQVAQGIAEIGTVRPGRRAGVPSSPAVCRCFLGRGLWVLFCRIRNMVWCLRELLAGGRSICMGPLSRAWLMPPG